MSPLGNIPEFKDENSQHKKNDIINGLGPRKHKIISKIYEITIKFGIHLNIIATKII